MIVPLLSLAMDKREWLSSMEAVLEALNEGVVITDENHRILFANSDLSGISIFEEAQFHGVEAAQAVLRRLGGTRNAAGKNW